MHLVESNNKKAAFLRTALAETGARGTVHPVRIETAPGVIPACDAVSARALAELDMLLDFVQPWMKINPSLTAYFHKGRDYRREVEETGASWSLDLVEHPSRIAPDSVVLDVRNVRRLDGRVEKPGGIN